MPTKKKARKRPPAPAAKRPRLAARVPSAPAKSPAATCRVSVRELATLHESLRIAQETLDAIRSGEVDAVIVSGANGDQVYSLAGAEQPYRVYVERMQEGAVTVSADGLVLYCNRRFADMLGQPLERVIGSSLREHLPAEAWSQLRHVFDHGSEMAKYETTLGPAADGLPVNLTGSRLTLDGPVMMCLVVTDLTAQKEKEGLRLAKEVAEKANGAKDEFLAALSHELRTPLTPALITAAALEKNLTLPESVRLDLALIRRNVELEARLIDDLLDLTLITHGKLSLQAGAVDLHASLNRAIEIVQADARAKQVSLQVRLGATHTALHGDPVRIQQVCWNVLRNAVKFTPAHGVVTVTTGNENEHEAWVRVTDTGIGFTPEQAGRMFTAFEQGSRHITRQFGGLGLGLAITRSIMAAHGGSIDATSPGPGRGATFTLHFPLAAVVAKKAGKTPAAKVPATRSLRILVVEDHPDTRLCIQRLLEASRHRITAVPNAQKALEAAENTRFDLVVSDLGLPDLTGHELMRRLRARSNIPGIALSGYGMATDVAQSRDAGFTHHLTKPVSLDQLKSFVAEFAAQADHMPEAVGSSPA